MTTSVRKLTAAAALVFAMTAGVWGFAPQKPAPAAPAPQGKPADPKPDADKRVADAAQRARSSDNLKRIMVAIHAYHDEKGHAPNNVADKDGNPILSWRVRLLPYLDQEALYKQFTLDEPWDGENNKKLLGQMPDAFRVGFEGKGEAKTHYQGFAGPGAVFEPGGRLLIPRSIPDGTTITLGVVEAGPPVEWTKPADIPYEPDQPLPRLDGPFANTFNASTVDGSTYTLRRDLDESILRFLIERADGHVVSPQESQAIFPRTREELEDLHKALGRNEKLLTELAGQYREQQKLLGEIGKRRKPDDPIGLSPDRLARVQSELEASLSGLKRETAALRKQAQGK